MVFECERYLAGTTRRSRSRPRSRKFDHACVDAKEIVATFEVSTSRSLQLRPPRDGAFVLRTSSVLMNEQHHFADRMVNLARALRLRPLHERTPYVYSRCILR